MDKKIKVLLADDHEIFRHALLTLINQEPDLKVVGEASNGEEALAMAENLNPDVIIMDIRMPKLNGIEASKLLLAKNPDAKILIFSLYDNVEYVIQALDIGAKGYLLKDTSNKIFLDAIKSVNKNKFYYIGEVSNTLINYYKTHGSISPEAKRPGEIRDNLSKREIQILQLIKAGKNSKEIADLLGNSVRTIDAHRYNIIRKFSAKNVEEVLEALENADSI